MKNLFDHETVSEVKTRLASLNSSSERQWGKMAPAQALAHCAIGFEWAVGDSVPPRMFWGQMVGRIIKPFALGTETPMRRNSPTAKTLIIADQRDLAAERTRLTRLIDRFAAGGPQGCTSRPHTFFGPMSPPEWAILMYKHLDHHLRQFGV